MSTSVISTHEFVLDRLATDLDGRVSRPGDAD